MIKSDKGFTATDIAIAIVTIIIFTSTILGLMYNVKNENVKLQAKLLSNIYLTETLENIGIADYDDVTSENSNLIPADITDKFHVTLEVTEVPNENSEENIVKRINAKITYTIAGKQYENSIQRLKIKE